MAFSKLIMLCNTYYSLVLRWCIFYNETARERMLSSSVISFPIWMFGKKSMFRNHCNVYSTMALNSDTFLLWPRECVYSYLLNRTHSLFICFQHDTAYRKYPDRPLGPHSHLNLTGVWEHGVTGRNVTVCVVDDGLEWDNPDLKPNYRPDGSIDLNGQDNDPMPDEQSDNVCK